MIFLGLTGGFGCGKSTVATFFQQQGAVIIDADQLARKVVEPGEKAHGAIVDIFGGEILLEDRTLNRKKLADIVFSDKEKLALLNKITHKEISKLRRKLLEEIYSENRDQLVLNDIPLLFEKGMKDSFQKTILVKVNRESRIQRLIQYRNFTEEEAIARIKNQMPQVEKERLADYIIDNNGSLENTEKQSLEILNLCRQLPQVSLESIDL